jgi:hypothetical protein
MRFRLSSLFIVVTLVAIAVGLGYQVVLLRHEVAEVRNELQSLKQRRFAVTFAQPAAPNPNNGPFRLLNGAIVDPATERGMKVDELQRRQRLEQQLKFRLIPAPERPNNGLGTGSL